MVNVHAKKERDYLKVKKVALILRNLCLW